MKKISVLMICLLLTVGCSANTKQEVTNQNDVNTTSVASNNANDNVEKEVSSESREALSSDVNDDKIQENKGIEGSDYIDVTLGLEDMGFPKHKVSKSELLDCTCVDPVTLTDAETGSEMTYDICYQVGGEIISANFGIMNFGPTDNEIFIGFAEKFLSYCASFPYDSTDADKAKRFIIDNIKSVGTEDDGAEIIIGDAKFELYGTTLDSGVYGMRHLRISKNQE